MYVITWDRKTTKCSYNFMQLESVSRSFLQVQHSFWCNIPRTSSSWAHTRRKRVATAINTLDRFKYLVYRVRISNYPSNR